MITFSLMLFAAQILPAPESVRVWEPLPQDEEGRHAYDPASISRDGDIARVVYRSIFRAFDESGARSMMRRYQVRCHAHTIGLEVVDVYGEDGRFIESREAEGDTVFIEPINPRRTPRRLVQLAQRACRR